MKHWKAITGVVLVFGLGMIAGGFVTLAVVRHRLLTRGPQVFGDMIVRRLSWELKLDGPQRQQVRAIVDDAQAEMKAVRQQIRPQMAQVFENSEGKIRLLLRPDQQTKFDRLAAESRQRWEQMNR